MDQPPAGAPEAAGPGGSAGTAGPSGPGPQGRYGASGGASPALRRRRLVVAVAVLLAGGVGYAVWFGVEARDQATFRSQGYDVTDDTHVEVTFTVSKPKDATAVCQVEALSSGAAQVGLASVPVGPSRTTATTVTTVVRTSERAVTGQPTACVLR